MSGCIVVGLGGSAVTGARSIAGRVSAGLSAGGKTQVRVVEAAKYVRTAENLRQAGKDLALAATENPSSYDLDSFRAEIIAEKDSGQAGVLLLVLGPLCAVPGIAALCTLKVFIDIEERLMLLRWADALMEAGSPGGVEALAMYSDSIEPEYRSWAPEALASSTLVLDEEEGQDLLAQKILWLIDKSVAGATPSASPSQTSAQEGMPEMADRLALIKAMESRYSHPAPAAKGFGPVFRMFMSDKVYPAMKRVLDVTLVSLLLMVIWPVFALVAFLIWLDDPGPVFYSQTRIGKYGKSFPFPKFRSMVRDADKLKDKLLAKNEMSGGITFKMKRDPRIIPIGFVIRKYSLDELPQLWSILKGDLSLVGPRPPVPREVALYTAADRRRLEAVPGLTCIWQVSGRSEIPFPRQVELDVEYLESRSLSLDLRLLLATIPAVLTGKGAY